MCGPERLVREINDLVGRLVELGLAEDQNYVFRKTLSQSTVEVTFPQAEHLSVALKDRPYAEVYDSLVSERALVVKLPDGALVQMQYLYRAGSLERHTLRFFPSPYLETFQNSPDSYMGEAIYAEVVAKSIVPFPIRFDFDCRQHVWKDLEHPKSHLTLGQYQKCRIPVTAPLPPARFVEFIIRNFYNSAFAQYADKLPRATWCFNECILPLEREVVHVTVPSN